jgi:hypothetical protein
LDLRVQAEVNSMLNCLDQTVQGNLISTSIRVILSDLRRIIPGHSTQGNSTCIWVSVISVSSHTMAGAIFIGSDFEVRAISFGSGTLVGVINIRGGQPRTSTGFQVYTLSYQSRVNSVGLSMLRAW